MIRRCGAVAVVAIVATALWVPSASAHDVEESGSAATVRVQARLLLSGKVEVGLRLDGDREWLPPSRLFPHATAEVGRWLLSSPYTLSDSTVVRVQARLLLSGKVEVGLRLDGDREWLPPSRLFPHATAEVGRWLLSSPYMADGPLLPVPPPANTIVLAGYGYDASDSADFAWYCDSGEPVGADCTGPPPVVRTSRPYALSAGTTFLLVDLVEPEQHWDEITVLCDTRPTLRSPPFAESAQGAPARVVTVRHRVAQPPSPNVLLILYPARPGQYWINFAGSLETGWTC